MMRHFMQIVETLADPLRKAAEIVAVGGHIPAEQFQKDGWHGKAHDPDTFDDVVPVGDALERLVARYEKLFASGSAILYRIMLLDPQKAKSIQPGQALGIYWCTDPNHLEPDALYAGQDEESAEQPMFLFSAQISFEAVDWVRTLGANISLPWEHEVCLRPGAPVHLIKVMGGQHVSYPSQLRGTVLNHLAGKQMAA